MRLLCVLVLFCANALAEICPTHQILMTDVNYSIELDRIQACLNSLKSRSNSRHFLKRLAANLKNSYRNFLDNTFLSPEDLEHIQGTIAYFYRSILIAAKDLEQFESNESPERISKIHGSFTPGTTKANKIESAYRFFYHWPSLRVKLMVIASFAGILCILWMFCFYKIYCEPSSKLHINSTTMPSKMKSSTEKTGKRLAEQSMWWDRQTWKIEKAYSNIFNLKQKTDSYKRAEAKEKRKMPV